MATPLLELRSPRGRWVLGATVLGSGMAFLDSTVVNVALPAIGRDLDTDVAGLQWIVTGYLVTLASLILLGGVLGDHFGRLRVFLVGVATFAGASELARSSDEPPQVLRQRVTSKGGTTHAAISSMEASQMGPLFQQAMLAARDRAREMGREFGGG